MIEPQLNQTTDDTVKANAEKTIALSIRKFLSPRNVIAFITGLFLVLFLFWREHECSSGGRFLTTDWLANLLWFIAPLVFLERTRKYWLAKSETVTEKTQLAPQLILFCFLCLFLFCGAVKHRWFYFVEWAPAGGGSGYFKAGMIRWILLTSLIWPFALSKRLKMSRLLGFMLLASQVLVFTRLIMETGGNPLYRDDHPSFIFRLCQFGSVFPHILTYNPFWNGGVTDSVLCKTGTTAVGVLLWPLWRIASVESVYTWAIGFVFIIFVPWMTYTALRIMDLERADSFCGALLSLGVSQYFFMWLLHFGTIGASLSSAFILPLCASIYRRVWLDKSEWWLGPVLIASAFFLVQWPPGMLMAALLVISMLLSCRQWSVRKLIFLAVCASMTMVLHAQSLILILTQSEQLLGHVLEKEAVTNSANIAQWSQASIRETFMHGFRHLAGHFLQANPLLVLLGVGGVFIVQKRGFKRWYIPMIVGLAFMAGWAREWYPNLQISRMAIPMLFVAIVPASIVTTELLKAGNYRFGMVRAALIALLVLNSWNVGKIYSNQTLAPYEVMGEKVNALITLIKEEVPEEGRVLFAGPAIHAYGRGHVAALPLFTGREMMACDYYAFPPEYVEYEYPPRPFRATAAGTLHFMDLYNVTHVVTYHKKWFEFFNSQPELYERVPFPDVPGRLIYVFKVKRMPAIFLKGSGSVSVDFNHLKIKSAKSDEEAVIKYNWHEGLKAVPPAEVFSYDAGDGINFIGIRPNGAEEVKVRFSRWL